MLSSVMKNPAAGGGRWVDVAPERLVPWMVTFTARHGGGGPVSSVTRDESGGVITFTAEDGATAECHPPFPPLPTGLPADVGPVAEAITVHALRPRTVGVLLVRLGGYAAGVFTGSPPELAASKAGSRPVHGRNAAGGWSQQRFARRREKQASEALQAAADAAATVFGGWGVGHVHSESMITARGGAVDGMGQSQLDAVVLGGDKRAVAGLRDDPRLAPYLALAADRFLTVPDPRRAVLEDTPRLFLAIKIKITEPSA
jgi:hypothetical protein